MNINSQNNNISYTGRCPQIKDAQWVCRTVRSAYPHIALTKIAPVIKRYRDSFSSLQVEGTPKKENPAILRILKRQKINIRKINTIREERRKEKMNDVRRVNHIIEQFKNDKLGNCGEDAFLSAAILKMNGVKNAYVAKLKTDKQNIDHAVCLFNKDGSVFDGKNCKNTIVVDSWLDCADFAANIFTKYKCMCKNLLSGINDESQIGFRDVRQIDISGGEALILTLSHDKLRFPSLSREFMK